MKWKHPKRKYLKETFTFNNRPKHRYPCKSWTEERSCRICRQIAEETQYLTLSEQQEYFKKLQEEK